mmetsp:Transcript_40350/g.72453  ORF Transcript_40350/g.72453 Transcript_40350/m.72453 type:complete len:177 (+) Transcript_40350:172-702(+)|eukprot:CAMPEP_0177777192 /NCGR_PEP_ID=MMETSP0491_2-20121128/15190_1 /TAXON_ID=63592 /ORGANISM="Tetraselmis chuii, Strain PLY429" /LENGTH=176 /DNA_ID=CAMNT_0019296183 /DNA_START=162 /DNA_END=692 /DNA_ORIENTATION=+
MALSAVSAMNARPAMPTATRQAAAQARLHAAPTALSVRPRLAAGLRRSASRYQRTAKPAQVSAMGPGTGLSPELRAALDEYVGKYKVVVFMKGTPQFPQCGFSNTVVQILNNLQAPFEGVNILEDDSLRGGLKEYSAWPTFPQIYIAGEFYGGCDIMIEEYQNGNLKETLERALME